jgi:hypothetical protein
MDCLGGGGITLWNEMSKAGILCFYFVFKTCITKNNKTSMNLLVN